MISIFTEPPKIMRKLSNSSETVANQKIEFSFHRNISISMFVCFFLN